MLDPKLAAIANIPSWKVIQALYIFDQLCGLEASLSSHPTRYDTDLSLFASLVGNVSFSFGVSRSADMAVALLQETQFRLASKKRQFQEVCLFNLRNK